MPNWLSDLRVFSDGATQEIAFAEPLLLCPQWRNYRRVVWVRQTLWCRQDGPLEAVFPWFLRIGKQGRRVGSAGLGLIVRTDLA